MNCTSNTYIFVDDVAGFKAHSSHFDSPNGATCTCQEKKTDEIKIVVKSSLSPESCLTENDTIPEEVSFCVVQLNLFYSLKE